MPVSIIKSPFSRLFPAGVSRPVMRLPGTGDAPDSMGFPGVAIKIVGRFSRLGASLGCLLIK